MKCPKNYPVVSFEATGYLYKSKRFNYKLLDSNQLVPNTILNKKVGQNYNFANRTIVLLTKQRF